MIVHYGPPTSALAVALDPEASVWQLQEHLLAGILDAVRVSNWQRGRARRHEYPQLIPRPGVEGPESIGSGGISMEEMAAALGWDESVIPVRPPDPNETEEATSE